MTVEYVPKAEELHNKMSGSTSLSLSLWRMFRGCGRVMEEMRRGAKKGGEEILKTKLTKWWIANETHHELLAMPLITAFRVSMFRTSMFSQSIQTSISHAIK